MIGVGIGSFVDGFARGYGMRNDMEDRKEAKADREADRAYRDEQRGWQAEDRAYQVSERDRQTQHRESIEQISADTRAAFDQEVASGAYKAEDYDDFWKKYALPRMQNELLMQGDISGAKQLMEWGESEAALEGGRLFAGAMFKAQTGDHAGALDDVIKAGKLRGYIAGDFDIAEKEPIQDGDGNLLGYRVTITNGDGNEVQQDIALDDIPTVISTFANPQAAWESQQAAASSEDKRKRDLEDYEDKKEIDQRYSNDTNKARESAIKSLRERMEASLPDEGAVAFDDLPRTQREKLIAEEISFMAGTAPAPTVPGARMIVDSNSGQPVPTPTAAPAGVDMAPGLGSVPKPQAQGGPATPKPAQAAPTATPTSSAEPDNGLPRLPTNAELVDQAAQKMVEGGDPQEIARMLSATGVDRSQWPTDLVRVLGTG